MIDQDIERTELLSDRLPQSFDTFFIVHVELHRNDLTPGRERGFERRVLVKALDSGSSAFKSA